MVILIKFNILHILRLIGTILYQNNIFYYLSFLLLNYIIKDNLRILNKNNNNYINILYVLILFNFLYYNIYKI